MLQTQKSPSKIAVLQVVCLSAELITFQEEVFRSCDTVYCGRIPAFKGEDGGSMEL
jgi:hypothetical protein